MRRARWTLQKQHSRRYPTSVDIIIGPSDLFWVSLVSGVLSVIGVSFSSYNISDNQDVTFVWFVLYFNLGP